jgi:hypothetical protein
MSNSSLNSGIPGYLLNPAHSQGMAHLISLPPAGPQRPYLIQGTSPEDIAQRDWISPLGNGTALQGLYDSFARIRQYQRSQVGLLTRQLLINVLNDLSTTIQMITSLSNAPPTFTPGLVLEWEAFIYDLLVLFRIFGWSNYHGKRLLNASLLGPNVKFLKWNILVTSRTMTTIEFALALD